MLERAAGIKSRHHESEFTKFPKRRVGLIVWRCSGLDPFSLFWVSTLGVCVLIS